MKEMNKYEKQALEAAHKKLDRWFEAARKNVASLEDGGPDQRLSFELASQGYDDSDERIVIIFSSESTSEVL